MKRRSRHQQGSALITVVALCSIMGLLTASMLRYTATERRGNERNRLALRSKNLAENVAIYASEQLTTKLYRIGSAPEMHFDWTGSGTNRIYPPPDSVLTSAFSSPSDVEVRAGIEEASAYVLVTDTTSPNYDLQVSTAKVPIIAKATVEHDALGSMTSYVQQDMELSLAPLFQFGMFYNMDMELYPSAAFTMAGPVHSNKRVMAMHYGSSNINITFLKRVTSAEGFYADATIKAPIRGGDGSLTSTNYSVGQIYLRHTNGTQTSLKNSSNLWRDHKYTTSTETTTTIANFRTFATNTYNGNLRTSAHGVTPLELPGIGTYQETDDPTTPEDERSNGRQIIEPPNADVWVWDTATSTGSWEANTDDGDAIGTKIAYKAGLFIMVNPDDDATPRDGTLPDGTTAWVLPHSYRAWLNATDSSGVRTCTEVVLPGQPTYGYGAGSDGTLGTSDDVMYRNYLPNRYTELSVGGAGGNQVLRIPQHGYDQGTGYLLNGAGAIGDTSLVVDSGTHRILPGEVVTIGSHRYLVAEEYAGGAGTLVIAAPGLLAAAADNTAVTISDYGSSSIPSPAYNTYKASGTYAVGTTSILLRRPSSGTGAAIIPGTAITIGSYKYLVTAAGTSSGITSGNWSSTSYTIGIAPLRASVASGVSASIDATPFTLGTGLGYRVNGAVSSGGNTLVLDTGAGTILCGDTILVDGKRHLVTSTASTVPTSAPTIQILPAADGDGIADDDVVMVDPFRMSGYSRSTAWPVANTGSAFPTNSTAPYVAADAYFFDTRRANANSGVRGLSGTKATYDRFSQAYAPRACAKIDFDMTRLKLMVERVMNSATTLSIYDVRAPNATGVTFANSIHNASGTTVTSGLGISDGAFAPANFDVFPATTDANTLLRPDPFNLYYAPANPETTGAGNLDEILSDPMDFLVPAAALYNDAAPDAWYDGVAIYLNSVDAEKRAQTSNVPDRIDSGVRLWNGRGPVVSLSTATKTGFTFVTNDALYTVGHFNADGTIDSSSTDVGTGSPNYYGGYSAQYPDSASEKLAALMADAFTPLSHPTWTSSSSGQVTGWNDALSAFPSSTTVSNWNTTSSATGTLNGSFDGVYASSGVIRPSFLPNSNAHAATLSATKNAKLTAVATEISAATLMGVVPSNHDPRQLTDGYTPSTYSTWGTPAVAGDGVNSGGANNFPRLIENWSGIGLYIRGSIVGLFESRVAMEPFTNGRSYSAPGRYWGLHYNFSQASHDVPLEPVVIGSTRVGFRELSAAEYTAKKAVIEAL